jgi:hydroxyacylglutathione hydrolase
MTEDTMKKLCAVLTMAVLFAFGCSHQGVVGMKAEAKPAVNTVAAVKAGKAEGTIDKEFFKKIVAEKPSNVTIVDVRTPFEYKAGHFEGSRHFFINDHFSKGCDYTLAQLPKEGFVVFVCATGARAGELYFGILEDCKYKEMNRLFYLDANVDYTPKGPIVR